MDSNTYNPHAKLFYRPIEVAIRWCGLLHLETQILNNFNHSFILAKKHQLSPCIQQKLEILWDAIRHQELPYGCIGVSVPAGETVEPHLLTVRHRDLRNWFMQFHPTEKPVFLFDDLERQTVPTYTLDTYKTLLVEIETLKTQYKRIQIAFLNLKIERDTLQWKNLTLTSKIRQSNTPSERNERAYLRLIGALINLLLGKSPSRRPYSSFTSQASIISALIAHNRNKPGFTQRTLENKFAAAKRSIDDSE